MRLNETEICEQKVDWGELLGQTHLWSEGSRTKQREKLACPMDAVAVETSGGCSAGMTL